MENTSNLSGVLDNNDNYTRLRVDIGRKSAKNIPKYIHQFLIDLGKETRGAFRLLDILPTEGKDPEHNIISIIFTLTVEAKANKYQEYSDALIYGDILPFITGCGFTLSEIHYVSYIPSNLQNIATSGELDVCILTTEISPVIEQILLELFGEDESNFSVLEEFTREYGGFRLKNKLTSENREAFTGLMNKLGIHYEIHESKN